VALLATIVSFVVDRVWSHSSSQPASRTQYSYTAGRAYLYIVSTANASFARFFCSSEKPRARLPQQSEENNGISAGQDRATSSYDRRSVDDASKKQAGKQAKKRRRRRRSTGSNNMKRSTATATTTTTTTTTTVTTTAAATVALCVVVFAHSYLLISVFPYGGYMAMELVPEATTETSGKYAGLISASFMVGRAFTSVSWGQLADTYGRKFALLLSLALSGITTAMFGLSQSFTGALVWRFALGLSNGLLSTAKVLASEIACGNSNEEAKVMNSVMSMWGMAFLVAPAIAGAVCEPLRQYPQLFGNGQDNEHGGNTSSLLYELLDRFPFFPPNAVGLLICVAGIVAVSLFIPETLPERKLSSIFCRRRNNDNEEDTEETAPLLLAAATSSSLYGGASIEAEGNEQDQEGCCCPPPPEDEEDNDDDNLDDEDIVVGGCCSSEQQLISLIQKDVEDAIRSSQIYSNSANPTNAITTRRARRSVIQAVTRRCKCSNRGGGGAVCCSGVGGIEAFRRISEQQQQQHQILGQEQQQEKEEEQQQQVGKTTIGGDDEEQAAATAEHRRRRRQSRKPSLVGPTSATALWRTNRRARNLMLVHWFGSFLMVALDEAFPLFCISPRGGLGLQENSIGRILSTSGIVFLILQLLFYAPVVDRLGLFGSMVMGCAAMPPFTLLISVSRILNRHSSGSEEKEATADGGTTGSSDLLFPAFVFLSIVMALLRAADLTFFT